MRPRAVIDGSVFSLLLLPLFFFFFFYIYIYFICGVMIMDGMKDIRIWTMKKTIRATDYENYGLYGLWTSTSSYEKLMNMDTDTNMDVKGKNERKNE